MPAVGIHYFSIQIFRIITYIVDMFPANKKPAYFLLRLVFFFWISGLFAQVVQNENKFYIEKISVEGNSKTRLNVIYENLGFSEGDSLTEDQINAGIEKLKQTEFFNEVTLSPRPAKNRARK